jgi:hypothetical protein
VILPVIMPIFVGLEKLLNDSYEAEIADKVQNYMKYDIVNNEKMTPRFLRMAKTLNSRQPYPQLGTEPALAFVDSRGQG